MSKKFLTDIDLSQNELLNAVIQNLSTAPQNPKPGQLYFSTNDMITYQWNGTSWVPVGKIYVNGNGITLTGTTFAADFASSSEATAGSSTTKVMSPALVKAVIQTLDVNGFSLAQVNDAGDTIIINGVKEADGKILADTASRCVIKIDAAHAYDPEANHLATVGTVNAAVQAGAVTLEAGNESATNLVSYTIKQGGTAVGTINIPKFLVLKNGSVVTGTWNGTTFTEDATQPGSGAGKAIKLVLNDSEDADTTDDVLYINVADLVDAYTAGAGITITAGNVVKMKLKSETPHTASSATPTNTASRQYAVGIDKDGYPSVNVPWENTTYTNEKLGQGYATCSTAAATAAKTASLTDYVLEKGGVVAVKFTNAVPANATLNINSKGAKSIYFKGSAITANIISGGDTATFIYDGTRYHLLAVDRLLDSTIKEVSWTAGNHYVTVTYSNGTSSNIAIHPTHTAYPESGNGAATPTGDQTPSFGGTFNVPQVVTDDFGHVTKQNIRKVAIPSATATQSAAGLMSAADKKKLDKMASASVMNYKRTNPALTATGGICTWEITDVGDENGSKELAICSLRDKHGNEVIADVQYKQDSIIIKINSTANIEAATYTAFILIPEDLTA